MDYSKATNKQLMTIAKYDNSIPTELLGGLAEETIKRRLWDGIITFAGEKAYKDLEHVRNNILRMDKDEFIHCAHIEIMRITKEFKPGMRSFMSFVVMCLISRFKKMLRAEDAEMRRANIGASDVNTLPTDIQERIFCSPLNVEKYVINKITIEEVWDVLREVEKQAILLNLYGYPQNEISLMLGFKSQNHANTLISRAYAKLRKAMVA